MSKPADEKRKAYLVAWRAANPEKCRAYGVTNRARNSENIKARGKARREKHSDREKNRIKAWREKNSDKVKAACAAYQRAHMDKARASNASFRARNPEKIKEYSNRYSATHTKEARIWAHNKRARKKANGGKLSPGLAEKLLTLQKNRCAICKTSLKKYGYHLDHIVPVVRGGKNEDRNMQATCPKCNMKKHSKDPIKFMQSLGYLL